jgi:ATP-dependent RNA helicase SUPV3L1/SUV3
VNRPAITIAELGPTNTGKTYRAVERMLEQRSGMIGLPLRLLAREVYDRVSQRVGEQAVALVTGEEKRIPPRPRYWVCTVESMPVGRDVDFVCVDEVQLAAHPQRGHVFTDRLLRARGALETWFLGAATMRPMIERLVPTASVRRFPRLSTLRSVGALRLSALPPRSAVIAFSAAEVYRLAELLRRRRGGAAIVLGALSPRTRNAQVAMYQAGEVDYLVATDAVGMGLNMDVDHVAFAALTKFDGSRSRALLPAELAQIAGRAGRHMRDGSFGTLAPLELTPEVSFAIEQHRFPEVTRVVWRNSDLDTASIDALLASLAERPRQRYLLAVDDASDHAVLRILAERPAVRRAAADPDRVRLLWDVCQIPDFRKLMVDHHAGLLEDIFLALCGPRGRLDGDFLERRVAPLEDERGDIDALLMRMDFIRTWNYVAHHADWVEDGASWQERTRQAEDRLSEALHERLIERFVEQQGKRRRRGRQRATGSAPKASAERDPLAHSGPFEALAHLRDALRSEAAPVAPDAWVEELANAAHGALALDATGAVRFRAPGGVEQVARLTAGVDLAHPELKLTLAREVGAGARARILRRLRAWVRDAVEGLVAPLRDPRLAALGAAGRGLVYQLEQQLGSAASSRVRAQTTALEPHERALLAESGIVIGRRAVFTSHGVGDEWVPQRLGLVSARHGALPDATAAGTAAPSFGPGRAPHRLCEALGYVVIGPRALRADVSEALDRELAQLAEHGAFTLPPTTTDLVGCDGDDLEGVVIAMGYHRVAEGFVRPFAARRSRRRRR